MPACTDTIFLAHYVQLAAGKERLQLPAGQNNCKAVHSSMTGKASRRVTFAISNVQQYPADQENVPI